MTPNEKVKKWFEQNYCDGKSVSTGIISEKAALEALLEWSAQREKEIREEEVEMMKKMKKRAGCGCPPFHPQHDGHCWTEEFSGEAKAYNQALDDTIKALQDN